MEINVLLFLVKNIAQIFEKLQKAMHVWLPIGSERVNQYVKVIS